jgi:hypothetical protein
MAAHLHKIEKVVQVQHWAPHRPLHRTLSCDFGDFLADSPPAKSVANDNHPPDAAPRRPNGTASIPAKQRLGAAATMLGVAPPAATANPFSFLMEDVMPNANRPYEPLTSENAAVILGWA